MHYCIFPRAAAAQPARPATHHATHAPSAPRAKSGSTITILQLTDIHVDPQYTPVRWRR